jgi:hypothetical protein
MKNGSITVNTSLLIKSLIMSFLLLSAAFIAGLVIGKNEPSFDRNKSKEESQLSACSFKLQEVSSKYLSLMEFAQSKGLLSPEGKADNNVICTYIVNDSEIIDEELVSEDNEPENREISQATDKKEASSSEKCFFSIQLLSDTNKKSVLTTQKRYNIKGTYIAEAVIEEKSWFRLKYGCFENRADAEKKLPEIREVVIDALVVKN